MTTKILALLCVVGLAGVSIAQDQSPSPGASQKQEPIKRRAHKKGESTTSAAETAESPSAAESPAASPKAKRTHKKAEATTAASPAESPAASPKGKRAAHAKAGAAAAAASPAASASPAKFSLGDLFKPKNSTAAASPAAAAPAAATAKGASGQTAAKAPAPGGGHGLVWVNSETHVYHKEGSRFYGTTKKGKYMTEAEAIKEGDKLGGERH